MDILGYRKVLETMDVFPIPSQESERIMLGKTFVRAIHLRRRLLRLLNDFMKAYITSTPLDLSRFPEEAQKLANCWGQLKLIQSPGPDHVILGCSLAQDEEHYPLTGVYSLVYACASAMIIQLMIGADDPEGSLPLRGGIDIAAGGTDPRDDHLYSAAVTRAYDLEREAAIYPRIIIGDRFQDYLIKNAMVTEPGLDNDYKRAIARFLTSMFFKDSDGKVTLDFFGETFCNTFPTDRAFDVAGKAWRFVITTLQRFQNRGDQRVREKYEWLADYMRPRLGFWGVFS